MFYAAFEIYQSSSYPCCLFSRLANPLAVGEFAKYLLTKRAESKPSDQKCMARFTPDALFLLDTSNSPEAKEQPTVLSNFKLAQIVHCVEIGAPDDKPG